MHQGLLKYINVDAKKNYSLHYKYDNEYYSSIREEFRFDFCCSNDAIISQGDKLFRDCLYCNDTIPIINIFNTTQ